MDRPPAQPARRRAERAARARRRRRRRLVLLLASAAGLALAAIAIAGLGGGGDGQTGTAAAAPRIVVSAKPAAPLPAPISGESAVAVPGGVLIIGGLDSSENSVSGVFRMSTAGGRLASMGSLSSPLHDAAAATLGSRVLVFGGGTATSTDAVESLPASGSSVSAEVVGHLPAPRSDLSAVTIGGQAYLLGGYNGETPDPAVLRTGDGVSFSRVATLPVPARYLAATVLNGRIYAFGGETAEGAGTDAIREIDPAGGGARLVGHLPEAVSHAAAVTLGGRIYVLGGEAGGAPLDRIWSFDPASGRVSADGRLPLPMSGAAVASDGTTAYLIGGKGRGGGALPNVVALRLRRLKPAPQSANPAANAHPTPNPASSPFTGKLMIADRGNNRIIVVNAQKKVLWRYPSHAHPPPPGGFYFPDDAFFTHHGTQIISNEEQDERIVQIGFPSGKLLWTYGHAGVTGSEPGYLHEPDDAYLWKDGTISVADAQNCRVLIISPRKKVLSEIGNPASCEHDPPRYLASPNGDTPLRDGNLLVSEVNGSYIDEITPHGKLVWSVQLPIAYPSDPQQLGRNRYLVADYAEPGGIYEFNRQGRILWSYHPSSGEGMLNHPSLAERLPNGLIAVNDDYRHRVVLIDRHSRRIVWQYGRTDHPGRGPGLLNTPDGFDLLEPGGVTPTHPFTG